MMHALIAWLRSLWLALFPRPTAPAPEQPPQSEHPPALAALPTVYAMRTGRRILTPAQVKALRAVPAKRDGWLGYDRGGFDFPATRKPAGDLLVQVVEGDWHDYALVTTFSAAERPGELLVLVYQPQDWQGWSCDANGEHCGTHPSAAVVVDAGRWRGAVSGGVGE